MNFVYILIGIVISLVVGVFSFIIGYKKALDDQDYGNEE